MSPDRQTPVPTSEIKDISKKALAATLHFHSMLKVDDSPEKTYHDLRSWWQSDGAHFFQTDSSQNGDEDDEDWLDLDVAELEDPNLEPEPRCEGGPAEESSEDSCEAGD